MSGMLQEAKEFLIKSQKLNLILVGINVVVFAVLSLMGDTGSSLFMLQHGAGYAPAVLQGEYYRLFTAMFLHFSLQHLVFNMICLLALGDLLERALGAWRYLAVYLLGGLAGNALSLAWECHRAQAGGSYAVSAGASGAVFAVIGAMLWIVLKRRYQQKKRVQDHPLYANTAQEGILRIPPGRMALAAALMILQGLTDQGVDNAAHIGGLAAGFALAALLKTKGRRG